MNSLKLVGDLWKFTVNFTKRKRSFPKMFGGNFLWAFPSETFSGLLWDFSKF